MYDIAKVNTWLRDNNASSGGANGKATGHYALLNNRTDNAAHRKRLTKLASITISEDEDNYDSSLSNAAGARAARAQEHSPSVAAGVKKKQQQQQQEAASEDSMTNKAAYIYVVSNG